MKLNFLRFGLTALVMLLPLGLAHAAKTEKIVKADTRDSFAALVTTVQQEMKPGGRYGYIDKKEAEDVNRGLAYMQSLLDRFGSVDQMSPDAKIDLFNHQEKVNAILTRRDNNRLVCESVAPMGSHIPRTTCRTYGLIEADRRNARQTMDNFHHVPQFKSGN